MKKLLTPILMAMAATLPFISDSLFADSQMNINSIVTREEAWAKMQEMKKPANTKFFEEDLIQLTHYFLSESDQVYVVDLRNQYEGEGMFEYWVDRFNGQCKQSPEKLDLNENECLKKLLATLHSRVEEGAYEVNQFNLATLQAITEGEFIENFEHRYTRFQVADGNLQNALFVDQFLQHADYYSNRIHVHYLPGEETVTFFLFLDTFNSDETLDSKQLINNYLHRNVSDSNAPVSEYVSRQSMLVIPKPKKSNLIYNELLCEYSVGGGFEVEWGGNEDVKSKGYVEGKVYDDRGNYLHGSWERTGERNKVKGDMGQERRKREREDH